MRTAVSVSYAIGNGYGYAFQIEAGEDHMSVLFRIPMRMLDELISARRF